LVVSNPLLFHWKKTIFLMWVSFKLVILVPYFKN
jgi:hypothetical protein